MSKIVIDRAVVDQALKALERADRISGHKNNWSETVALRTAMEKPQVEQEPVAVVTGFYGGFPTIRPLEPATVLPYGMALYAHPQPPFAQGEKRNDQT